METLITNENLSVLAVKTIFDNAFIDNGVDEKDCNSFWIKENWKTWVYIDEKKRFLSYSIYLQINPNISPKSIEEYLKYINSDYIWVKAVSVSNEAVMFKAYLWVEGGISHKNVIRGYKGFLGIVEGAAGDDKEGVLS